MRERPLDEVRPRARAAADQRNDTCADRGAADDALTIARLSRIEDAFDETRVAPPLLGPAQRHRDRPPLADEDAETLRARHRGVEERPRKHVRIRRRPWRDDGRELRSLCPVHGERPGEACCRRPRVSARDDLTRRTTPPETLG